MIRLSDEAEIRALRIYAVANIADLLKKEGGRDAQFATLSKITLQIYDEHIATLESKFPALASMVDVRANMSQQDQEVWYLLEKYYPRKDQPPNTDNQV
jgi:hypothetical protein